MIEYLPYVIVAVGGAALFGWRLWRGLKTKQFHIMWIVRVTRLENPGFYWLNVLSMALGLAVSLLLVGLLLVSAFRISN